MKKKLAIIDTVEENIDYIVYLEEVDDVTTYNMVRSLGSQWNAHVRGEKLFSATLDGNLDIEIDYLDKDPKKMNISQVHELQTLLKIICGDMVREKIVDLS